MVNVIISGKNVTAQVDGIFYTRQNLTKDESDLLSKLAISYLEKPNEKDKKEILAILKANIKDKVEELAKVETERKIINSKLEGYNRVINDGILPNVFTVIDNGVYLKGFEKVQMPDALVDKIVQCNQAKEDIESYINFWKLCLMNPNPDARQGAYKYIQNQNLIITKKGYIVCYRMSAIVGDTKNTALETHVISESVRLRKSRLSLKGYTIGAGDNKDEYLTLDHRTKRYETFKGKTFGTVAELLEKFQKDKRQVFTDNHTKTMRFSMGEVVKIPREKCDSNPNQECSRGLHVGTPKYLSHTQLGQAYMLVFVNPMHIVSVPYADGHKMRVCEYYFSAVLDSLDEIKKIDSSNLTVFDDEYCTYELSEIETILKDKSFNKEIAVSGNAKEKEEALRKKEQLEQRFETLRKEVTWSGDVLANDISLDNVRQIVKSRKQ